MSLLILALLTAVLLTGLALVGLLVLLLVGIHAEERHMSLTSTPRTRVGLLTRHMLGVYVRQPRASRCPYQDGRR